MIHESKQWTWAFSKLVQLSHNNGAANRLHENKEHKRDKYRAEQFTILTHKFCIMRLSQWPKPMPLGLDHTLARHLVYFSVFTEQKLRLPRHFIYKPLKSPLKTTISKITYFVILVSSFMFICSLIRHWQRFFVRTYTAMCTSLIDSITSHLYRFYYSILSSIWSL